MPGTDAASQTIGAFENPKRLPSSLRFALACVITFAAVLFIWKAMIVLGDPTFRGDAAVRMLSANRPIARMGNRVWLPYLQLQILGLAKLHVPYSFFNLIPCLHLFLAALGLGLLGLRLLGRNWQGILISFAIMFCFAQQQVIVRSSLALYQEITGIALFYFLLHGGVLELARRHWLLILGSAALLARDSLWIYFFALTLLNYKKILTDNRYRWSFAFLWAIPVLWLATVFCGWLVFEGRPPAFPTEWPLMINKDGNQAVSSLAASLRHLWDSAFQSRVVYLVLAGLAAGIVHAVELRQPTQSIPNTRFAHYLKSFSILSLAVCYGLVLLFDPWQFTAGSGRMYTPAIEQCFVWFLLIAAATRVYRPAAKAITLAILAAGMLAGISTRRQDWMPVWNSAKVSAYEEIASLVQEAAPGRKPMACMIGDHFREMSDYCAAIYRASHKLLPAGATRIPDFCDAAYTTLENVPPDPGPLVRSKEYILDGRGYVLFLRPADPHRQIHKDCPGGAEET